MHAVRGTIGYDPNPVNVEAKQASRDKHFGIVREGDTFLAEAADDDVPGFLVEWVNPAGQERYCGRASGGISAESVVRLIGILSRTGRASVFTVTRTR